MGFSSDHRSNFVGSIPVTLRASKQTRDQPEQKSSHLPVRTCKLIHMTESKKYSPVGKTQPRVGKEPRRTPLHKEGVLTLF
jgi:hypothetical protein